MVIDRPTGTEKQNVEVDYKTKTADRTKFVTRINVDDRNPGYAGHVSGHVSGQRSKGDGRAV